MAKYICLIVVLYSCAFKGSSFNYAQLEGFQYPFKVKKFSFPTQNQMLQMAYMDIGESNEDIVVLLHGKNFASFYWEKVANDLVRLGKRVIIPDQIGFGKSSKPNNYQYSFNQLALNTKSLLENLQIKSAIIVGHSMGGMLATTFTHEYPKMVEKLVLINPIGLEYYGKYVEFKDVDFFYNRELNKTVDKIRNYQKKNYYDGKWSDEYEKLLEPHKIQLKSDDWNIVAWNNALTYGPIFSENIPAKFKDIKNPTTLIIGTRDRTGPGRGWKKANVKRKLGQYDKLGKQALSMFPNAGLYELDGVGHMPFYEAYDQFIKIFKKSIK